MALEFYWKKYKKQNKTLSTVTRGHLSILCFFTYPLARFSVGFAWASLALNLRLCMTVKQHGEWFRHTGIENSHGLRCRLMPLQNQIMAGIAVSPLRVTVINTIKQ